MGYGLPADGEPNWGNKIRDSIDYVKGLAESAVANANTARSTADSAANKADSLSASTDAQTAQNVTTGPQTQAALSATIADVATDGAGDVVAFNDDRYLLAPGTLLGALPAFSYIAHRGGSLVAPEETMEAYRTAVATGANILEGDLNKLADGSYGLMHDDTVDRTTTSSGNCTDYSCFSWLNLNVDAGNFLGGSWSNTLKPALFSDWLAEFGNKILLMPEIKAGGSAADVCAQLRAFNIRPDAILIQSFTKATCQAVIAQGYEALWLGSITQVPVADAVAAGIKYVGIDDTTLTQAYVTAAHAAGLKVFSWTVNRRWRAAELQSWGVDGIFTDDPAYMAGLAVRTTDPFGTGTWYPGMIAGTYNNRGKFFTGNYWGLDGSVAGTGVSEYVLHGSLRPPSPAAFTMTFTMRIDTIPGSDLTRWGSVALLADDVNWGGTSNVAHADGYQFLMRANGQLDIFRITPTAAAVSLGSLPAASGTDLVLGADVTYKITVTGTTLKLERGAIPAEQITVTNSDVRPGYLHLGRNGCDVRFKGIALT